jgi:aspartyl-tRNA(Asn)/glutamyl-tRNA(Gln) amidotransferase subunit B
MSIQHLGIPVNENTEFETVIGLEVHVQLATHSKIFSTARARLEPGQSVSEESVNANTTPVDAGHPGTLPALNKKAVEFAVRAGLATGCRINTKNVFSRKHYFYPDSPKGYQISQFDLPICENGFLDIEFGENGEHSKRVGMTRIHMEEDAGKNVHLAGFSLVNLNRAGVPLIEVVSEPDMRSPAEAGAYMRKLYGIVTSLEICDGNLQEGNFRCDANVSIRPKGSDKLGTRTEIKNVNSFRFVEKAIEYEVERQRQVILSGEKIVQETRLYDSTKNQTFSMRSKEEAQDYRYFPDPDLLPLVLDPAYIEAIRITLPELPDQKRDRFVSSFGLSRYDATAVTADKALAAFFETTLSLLTDQKISPELGGAKTVSNLLTGEASRLLNEANQSVSDSKFKPEHFVDLVKFIQEQTISATAAKQIIALLFNEGAEAKGGVDQLVEREGLKQVNDTSALEPIIDAIIAANPKQTEDFRAGKEKLLGFFVGQAMKETKGKANPAMLQDLVLKKLKGN